MTVQQLIGELKKMDSKLPCMVSLGSQREGHIVVEVEKVRAEGKEWAPKRRKKYVKLAELKEKGVEKRIGDRFTEEVVVIR